jgi:RNA polymerase sigma factor (sigma-70 family)
MLFTKMQKCKIEKDTSDEMLMQQLQDGHNYALDEIMVRYKQRLFSFIKNYIKDSDSAQDILQETFIRVYFKSNSFNQNYKFSTWLYKIAINLCRDHSRKEKLRQYLSLDAFLGSENKDDEHLPQKQIADPASNVEDITDLRQNLITLDEEIQKLPHKLKTALILFSLEENSQEKCAKILGTTPKAVEMLVYRARKILSKKMSKKFEG